MSSSSNQSDLLEELNNAINRMSLGVFGELTDDTVWDSSGAEMPRDHRQEPLNDENIPHQIVDEEVDINNNDDNTCSVCYVSKSDKDTIVTECKHVYCRDCFFVWLKQNTTCALCRHDFCDWRDYSIDELEPILNDLQIVYKRKRKIFRNCIKNIEKLNKDTEKLKTLNDVLIHRQLRLNKQFKYTLGYQAAFQKRNDAKIEIPLLGSYKEGYLCGLKDFCEKKENKFCGILVKHSLFYKKNKKIIIKKTDRYNGELTREAESDDTESVDMESGSPETFIFRGQLAD